MRICLCPPSPAAKARSSAGKSSGHHVLTISIDASIEAASHAHNGADRAAIRLCADIFGADKAVFAKKKEKEDRKAAERAAREAVKAACEAEKPAENAVDVPVEEEK